MEKIIQPGSGRRGWRVWLLAGLIAVACTAAAWFILFRLNRFTLTLEMDGASEIALEYGEAFRDPGARGVLRGSRFWKDGVPISVPLTVEGEVNPGKIGKYTLSYRVSIHSLQSVAHRTVRIQDTVCPEIILSPDPEGLQPAPEYQEAGFQAVDNYDGDITEKVIRTEEEGLVTYAVVDSSGNPAVAQRQIPVWDKTPPEITLFGGEVVSLPVGTEFCDPGFSAIDAHDGDLTEQTQVECPDIERFAPGEYEITYRVCDEMGNEAVAIRKVIIKAAEHPEVIYPQGKVIYLTFDDGPCPDTVRLLDILDRYDAKATFFVVDTGYPEIMKRIVSDGHGIAVHTQSHDYGKIYSSPEAFYDDLMGMQQVIYDATGIRTWLMRFPGGSSNTVSKISPGIMTLLTRAVEDSGFCYFDWNVDSMDAGGANKASQVFDHVIEGVRQNSFSVVLQHDIHPFSVDAVERILRWGTENGYVFLPLDASSPGVHHGVAN